MADVKWIKITTDIFDDEKILLIESMPSSDSIITIWFKLLILAGKQNNNGVFMMSNKLPYTDEMLATIFRRDINTVRLALSTFEKFGMIEIVENVITIPNWNKHQTLDAYERKKERDRAYQKDRRERQKMLIDEKSSDKSSDVAVSEEEREEDKDIEKENTKERAIFFDAEKAWNDTFSLYPKKSSAVMAKNVWMDKLLGVIESNRKDVAKLIYNATKMYLDDYDRNNPEDENHRYIPKYCDWLVKDCDYWISEVEKKQRGDDS